MALKSIRQALNEALAQEMRRDPRVIVIGEDVAGGAGSQGQRDAYGGVLGVTKGLIGEFGEGRVVDTPITESAIMGAAAGMAGSARAQYDLRRSCVFLDMHPVNRPEVLIGQAHTKFDAAGHLTDEAGRGFIRDLLLALAEWTRLLGRRN